MRKEYPVPDLAAINTDLSGIKKGSRPPSRPGMLARAIASHRNTAQPFRSGLRREPGTLASRLSLQSRRESRRELLREGAHGRRREAPRRSEREHRGRRSDETLEEGHESTAFEILADEPVGEKRDAEALSSEERDRLTAIRGEATAHRYGNAPGRFLPEAPDLRRRSLSVHETLVVTQVGRNLRLRR